MVGNPVSFNQPEMQEVVSAMDLALNTALRRSLSGDTQPFAVTAKVSFIPRDGVFRMEYEVGHQFDPIKQKEKGARRYPLRFEYDDRGIPSLSSFSDQVSLDETLEAREESAEAPIYPCECTDCPLHTGYTGGDEGCSFCGDVDTPLDSDTKGYIYDAVTVHRCTRGCIGEICAREFPADQPEPEPYPCEETDCQLCDFGEVCDLHEDGTSLVPYEDKHIISAVEDFRCTRKFVRKRYGEIVEEANRDE